ncbi:unnamed protein product, partial [Dibothriocephalus latus]
MQPELSQRIEACIQLNATYQSCFRKVKAKLKEDPEHPQFEVSENYIFGKFDTFCNRLKKIEDLATIVEDYAPLLKMKIENLESVVSTYKGMQDKMKKRSYDPTDQSKKEFNVDYEEFMNQRDGMEIQLSEFLNKSFSRPSSVRYYVVIKLGYLNYACKQLRLLSYFDRLKSTRIDLMGMYTLVLKTISRELEHTRNVYERQKDDPPIERNLTPVAGKIHWARHLLQRVQEPIEELNKRCPAILR